MSLINTRDLRGLRKLLAQYVTESEMKNICFDMGINWESISIGATSIEDKIRDFLLYIRPHQDKYPYSLLFELVQEIHPTLDFTPYGGPGPQPVQAVSRPARTTNNDTAVSKPEKKQMGYENFDIVLREELDDSYTVSASHDFRGGAQATPHNFKFDFDDEEFSDLYSYLEQLVADKSDITALGKRMYEILFPPSVSRVYMTLRERLREDGLGVRIRVNIQSSRPQDNVFSKLIHLPWEYCYDAVNNQFIGRGITTPLVRYVPREYTPDPLTAVNKLRILMVLSNPTDVPPLNVEAEEKIMREALGNRLNDKVELEVLKEVTKGRLYRAVNRFDPHIIHFVGHGTYEDEVGALIIETDEGLSRNLTVDQFASLLEGRSVKIVVLNACETSSASAEAKAYNSTAVGLVYARIPAVIAMQFRVPDNIALQFTETLYWQIAQGTPLDRAVSEMRLAVSLGDSEEAEVLWGIPTLYMRAADGQIWAGASGSGKTSSTSAAPATTAAPSQPAQPASSVTQSGGTNINIGGNMSAGSNISTGDIVFGSKNTATSGTINQTNITGNVTHITNNYGSGGDDKESEPSLTDDIKQIQNDVEPHLGQLDPDDAADIQDNLEEALESASSASPRGKRISRKLGNVLEVLEDNDVDNGLIDQLDQAIRKAKAI